MSSYTRQMLEGWLKTIDVKADRVVDIGGSQLPVKDRVKKWQVKEYKILDLEKPHQVKQKPDIVWDINFANNIEWEMNYFDVAFCLEVMEYMWNPVQALKNIYRLLKKGGLLYISFHFIYPHHNPEGKDYLRYTRWGVEKLLKETGFEIKEFKIRELTNVIEIENVYITEGMKGLKKYDLEQGYLIKCKKI